MDAEEVQPLFQTAAKLELANKDMHDNARVSWTTTKWSILRLTGMIYLIAFLGAYYQNPGLMGSQGLQPASLFFKEHLRPKYD
eukprot:CAMPEP_0176130948 /NCGR_PEP_ID=MMETSP0120_2-20121206/66275_1 /TAXON_ID=160619 /ORGANISM="Kryptoperidinium foliaceum, Strain CCMP 1326" /LENGTH=82 /DNA_ID=CAMNT_0017466283 /DNA_START=12 /DNA_END=257 /DNA_ORIENTATION=-